MTDAAADTTAPLLPIPSVGNCLAFFASVIKCGESWTTTCQREYDEAQRQIANAKTLDKAALNRAISHAVSFHGLDAKLDTPDWVIADLITQQVFAHLAGTTDVQVVERMSPEERDHALREATGA